MSFVIVPVSSVLFSKSFPLAYPICTLSRTLVGYPLALILVAFRPRLCAESLLLVRIPITHILLSPSEWKRRSCFRANLAFFLVICFVWSHAEDSLPGPAPLLYSLCMSEQVVAKDDNTKCGERCSE